MTIKHSPLVKLALNATTVVLLTACAAASKSPGDLMIDQGGDMAGIGEQWNQGTALIQEGRRALKEGQNLVDAGHRKVAEGQAKISKGKSLIETGQRLVSESESRYRQHSDAPAASAPDAAQQTTPVETFPIEF
ncbi:MAG: hypothetical protein RQ715_03270 [Methylococcales bacterium]|nr:hypothetical protein [Methylococcales bacterium]